MGSQPLSVFTRVLPLLQHALPVPFSLDNNQMRNNTTTAHVALREAFANSLIHAAYTVRGNIVIDRYFDRIVCQILVQCLSAWKNTMKEDIVYAETL